jgi:hypothetical protein
LEAGIEVTDDYGGRSRFSLSQLLTSGMTTLLPILAFNDVYRVRQKYSVPAGHATRDADGDHPATNGGGKPKEEYITVGQFGKTLLDLRNGWDTKPGARNGSSQGGEEEKEGLVLFAGDGAYDFLLSNEIATLTLLSFCSLQSVRREFCHQRVSLRQIAGGTSTYISSCADPTW